MTHPESPIFTLIVDARSSQNREEVITTAGPISRKSSVAVSGVSGKFIAIPPQRATPMPHIWSTIQAVGVMDIQLSPREMGVLSSHFRAISAKLKWGIMASFGTPVVPDVMIMRATSSGLPLAISAANLCGSF